MRSLLFFSFSFLCACSSEQRDVPSVTTDAPTLSAPSLAPSTSAQSSAPSSSSAAVVTAQAAPKPVPLAELQRSPGSARFHAVYLYAGPDEAKLEQAAKLLEQRGLVREVDFTVSDLMFFTDASRQLKQPPGTRGTSVMFASADEAQRFAASVAPVVGIVRGHWSSLISRPGPTMQGE